MGNGEGSVEWEWGRGKGGHFSDFLLTTILTFPGGGLVGGWRNWNLSKAL